ncbi:trypsin-like peptidase domain-containing protein [Candidatus Saccharibacteria bacterium]|nr:trypsin-like peptidase domain-containing protein [Candidatus Saccharibacteria bacterium]
MESGTSTNSTNTHDWRNYRSSSAAAPHTGSADNYIPNTERRERHRDAGGAALGLAIFSLLVGIAGIVFGVLAFVYVVKGQNEPAPLVSPDGYYAGNSTEFEETSIAGIANKVTPAVVSIVSSVYSTNYFGYGSTSQAAGTGMIVTKDGYILTNKHVIDGATDIKVITDAGDTYEDVEVVGTDPLNDVAYLKINGVDNLPTVTLGDSKTIAVGQPVLAIGNALGAYQNSVTQGIISGTGREVAAGDANGRNVEYLTDMLQTDAAINPGNSGGPLVNAAGDVIGINTAVAGDANGLGFAIPISATKGMLNNIIKNNKAERAYIGVSYVSITPEVAKEYNLSVNHGAYVKSTNGSSAVVKGSPAEKAGIKDGDIISKVGNVEVGRAGSVSTLVGEYMSGDTVQFTILRDGEEKIINVTLGSYK